MRHIYKIDKPCQNTPNTFMPDGAITGNGDLGIVWGGTPDRVQLYMSKVDFWKANPISGTGGGTVPLGLIEILMPYMAYSPFCVEQDLDKAQLRGYFSADGLDTKITVSVCATENTILLEIDSACPGLSTSVDLTPLEGNGAVCEKVSMGNIQYITRSFDGPELYFPTAGIAVQKEISRVRANGRVVSRWTIHVCTNHDSAAYKQQALHAARGADSDVYEKLVKSHNDWWEDFWKVSSFAIENEDLELQWYMGLYTIACCSRNKRFAPGLWGNSSTSDEMWWHGDYHLNYDYFSPYPPMCVANHPELMDAFEVPLYQFLPQAREYAKRYLGCRGVYYPVGIGPFGMSTCEKDYTTKEHFHLFLGHKTNAVHTVIASVIRWHTTHDVNYAKNVALPLLLEVAAFWEDYLVKKEDGKYYALNDSHHEVQWWRGPDYLPWGHDDVNSSMTLGYVRALFKCLLEMCGELNVYTERFTLWNDILDNFGPAKIKPADENTLALMWRGYEDRTIPEGTKLVDFDPKAPWVGHTPTSDLIGKNMLYQIDNTDNIDSLIFEYVYPAGQASPIYQPEIYEAAQNTMKFLEMRWEEGMLPYIFSPAAARLGVDPHEILERLQYKVENTIFPNGLNKHIGGGMEGAVMILSTLQEMVLQSYDNVVRVFPNWDLAMPAAFTGWRTYGAFIVDGTATGDGTFEAKIVSEKGRPLNVYVKEAGYALYFGDICLPLADEVVTVETVPGQIFYIKKVN